VTCSRELTEYSCELRAAAHGSVLFFKSYEVMIQASDGQGRLDTQDITVNVTADKMKGDAAP
jgi:hypothetical protein